MKKTKKNKRTEKPTMIPESAKQSTLPSKSRGGFFWGLCLGFLVTLGFVVSGDLGWNILPAKGNDLGVQPGLSAGAQASAAGQSLFLAGDLPRGAHVYVDGNPAPVTVGDAGVQVAVSPKAKKIEVRSVEGTWWSTRLNADSGDTLHPLLGGEIVVEVERQGRTGDLYVDGELVGTVPGAVSDVGPGWHIVSVRDGNTVLFEDACEVTPGEVTLVVVPPVPPRGKGRVTVRARLLGETGFEELEGSSVWIDGEAVGKCPFVATLDAGFHSVRVEAGKRSPLVEVINAEAGAARYVNAEFGREERLEVLVAPPKQVGAKTALAIPVHIRADNESVLLEEGFLYVVRPDQATAIGVPLVPSGTDPDLWVAVVPENLTGHAPSLTGYAACVDDMGRRGESELFRLTLR